MQTNQIIIYLLGLVIFYVFLKMFTESTQRSEPFFGNLSDTWNLVPNQSFDYQEMHDQFDAARNVTPDFDKFSCGSGSMNPNHPSEYYDPYRAYSSELIGQISGYPVSNYQS